MAIVRTILGRYNVALFYLLSVVFTSVTGECHSRVRPRVLHAAKNRALTGYVYAKQTAPHLSSCVVRCMIDDLCESLNFFTDNKCCQLSNASRNDPFTDFSEILGSVYLDVNEDTRLLSVSDDMYCNNRRSCKMIFSTGYRSTGHSGMYTIYPHGSCDSAIRVYCDMELDGGGWTVFQRRQDGSVDFYRNWADYRAGFGNLSGEFWLGNDNLVALTSDDSRGTWEIRFDLWDWEDKTAWAKYENFKILDEENKYALDVGNYHGTAGDSFEPRPAYFSTKDQDNDWYTWNCAEDRGGGWWFGACAYANLNGVYHQEDEVMEWGLNWYHWKGNSYSLKNCTIKIRETGI